MSTDAHNLDLGCLDLLLDAVLICTDEAVRWHNHAFAELVAGDPRSVRLPDLPGIESGVVESGVPFPLTVISGDDASENDQTIAFEARARRICYLAAPALLVVARPTAHRKAAAQDQRALSRFIISATTLTHPSNERSHDIELELGRLVGDYADYFRFDRVELLDGAGHLALSVEDSMVEIDHDGSEGIWAEAATLGFLSAHRLLIGNRTGEMHLFHRHEGSAIDQLDTHSLFAEVLLSALHNGREVGQLRFAAAHDALTGLPNRVGFRAGLQRQIGTAVSALLFIDLDGFKAINDELGHHVGDAVLAETARRLQLELRPGDLAARLGGDEFAVAVATSVEGHLAALAQRLVEAIERDMVIGPFEVRVGASIGYASLGPDDSLDDLMAAADKAMYDIKSSRRVQRQR